MPKQTFNAKRLLVVHAHPDDESIFTGHIIAERLAAGAEVYVLTLTRGERGKVKLEELKGLEGQLRAMGAFRTGELKVALPIATSKRSFGSASTQNCGAFFFWRR